ncbi:MAG: carboxypeptidase-like regulatory domain-containing protein [bacterium]
MKGLVRDEKGDPVSNAIVSFSKSPSPQQDISILTGNDGKFVMSVPSGGSYQLGINAAGKEIFDSHKFNPAALLLLQS